MSRRRGKRVGRRRAPTIKKMVDHKVPMTSTLAVFEPFFQNRPVRDERTLDAMAPEVKTAYLNVRAHIDTSSNWTFTSECSRTDGIREGVRRRGRPAGSRCRPDGLRRRIAGIRRPAELRALIEAGFTPQQAVQIMSANGAKILGVYGRRARSKREKRRISSCSMATSRLIHPRFAKSRPCSKMELATTRRS